MKPSAADLSDIASLLACPECCAATLEVESIPPAENSDRRALRCHSCGAGYPEYGGVACVIREPAARVELWREDMGMLHLGAEQSIELRRHELRLPGLLPLTRDRLREEIRITGRIVEEVDELLVGAIGPPRPPTRHRPGFESRESLRSLHRDWGWPESDENARAVTCVEAVISAPLGRTLILGAGACRLAYDLARRDPAALFVALDDDPLVLLTANRVLRGETVSLTEARSLPTDMNRLSAVRALRVPHGPATRVVPLLADGLAPPFRPGAFDTVLTPWFIDVVSPDVRDLVGVLRRMLLPGGRWLHFGPLLYPPERPAARQYSREELLELARRGGFFVEAEVTELLPFSASPLEDRIRIEPCLALSARVVDVPATPSGELPSWIVLPCLPVPDFDGRAAFFHESPGFRRVVQSIDGRRSVDEIASNLGAPAGTDPAALKDAVRECLLAVHPVCAGLARG